MKSDIVLFWEDKNWRKNGEAFHLWLQINYDTKYAKLFTSFNCNLSDVRIIEVKHKTDILNYACHLSDNGFNVEMHIKKKN